MQQMPMMVQLSLPPQQSCAVNCMSITSMVIGILALIGALLSTVGGDWGGVVLGLTYGSMIVTATGMWSCECCGNKRQNGRKIQRLLFGASIVMIIAIIVSFVRISLVLKCEDWNDRDDAPDDVVEDFEKRDDTSEDWEEWSSNARLVCVTARSIAYSTVGISFLFVGLVLGTAFLIRQQLAQWDMMAGAV